MADLLRVVFLAHAFPRSAGDLTGGFLLRLATALKAEGVEGLAVAPAAQGLAPRSGWAGSRSAATATPPRRAERLAYAGEMHRRRPPPRGATLAGLLGAGALAARRAAGGRPGPRPLVVPGRGPGPGRPDRPAAGHHLHGTDVRLARPGRRPGPPAPGCCGPRPGSRPCPAGWPTRRPLRPRPGPRSRSRPCPWTTSPSPPARPASPATSCCSSAASTGRRAPRCRGRPGPAGRPGGRLPLRCVGGGPRSGPARLAGELGVAGRVRWDGQLPQAELAGRYRGGPCWWCRARTRG